MIVTFAFAILLVILLSPLSRMAQRLPRRRLGVLRVVLGLGMIVLAAVSLPGSRARPLQLFGVGMILWGLWMLRPVVSSETL